MTDGQTILSKTAKAYNDGFRYIINSGGTRSGKTFAILTLLHRIAFRRDNILITVVSETFPHLRKGAIRDFEMLLRKFGAWDETKWNKTESTYQYHNGSKIEFFSTDSQTKVHGPQRDILFINEAQNIPNEIARHLLVRTSSTVFLDFNPTHEFWVHRELSDDPLAIWIHSTYLDNDYLSIAQRNEIERNKTNSAWWRVYGLGLVGQVEGLVFPEFEIIDSMPDIVCNYGLDFGYTNDPTALVEVAKSAGTLYLNELIYSTGLTNQTISKLFQEVGIKKRYHTIYADSAEPKSIAELQEDNWNVKPVVKGKDSVLWGVGLMLNLKIAVTKQSVNLIKELRNYRWDTDRNGDKINNPIDSWNHVIDAARYAVMMLERQNAEYKIYYETENRMVL